MAQLIIFIINQNKNTGDKATCLVGKELMPISTRMTELEIKEKEQMGKSLQNENLWDLEINWLWRRGSGKQLLRGFKSS